MCDCIEKINEKIREKYEDPEAGINCIFIHDNYSLKIRPLISATYYKIKKDGTFQTKKSNISITPTFCPFCGKEYPGKDKPE